MSTSSIFAISAAGMALEGARVKAAALNLANAHTTAAPGQTAYSPMHVVARAASAQSFASLMQSDQGLAALRPEFSVEPTNVSPKLVHDPGHPLADKNGFVSYPGVDPATEMVTMMSAMRYHEANVAAFNTERTLALKSLDIGGNS
jgi:flagellar basal-body rod protein FlgC